MTSLVHKGSKIPDEKDFRLPKEDKQSSSRKSLEKKESEVTKIHVEQNGAEKQPKSEQNELKEESKRVKFLTMPRDISTTEARRFPGKKANESSFKSTILDNAQGKSQFTVRTLVSEQGRSYLNSSFALTKMLTGSFDFDDATSTTFLGNGASFSQETNLDDESKPKGHMPSITSFTAMDSVTQLPPVQSKNALSETSASKLL